MSAHGVLRAPSAIVNRLIKHNSCGLIRVSGRDTVKYLQGLATNDLQALAAPNSEQNYGYTAWLNSKGRFMFDTMVGVQSRGPASFIIEVLGPRAKDSFQQHLNSFKLRSQVTIEEEQEHEVWSLHTTHPDPAVLTEAIAQLQKQGVKAVVDPREPCLGLRLLVRKGTIPDVSVGGVPVPVAGEKGKGGEDNVDGETLYNILRILHGVPIGGVELIGGKTVPLEASLDLLNAVHFHKGCYLGQELTARTHFKGLVRKRLVPVYLRQSPSPSSALAAAALPPPTLLAGFPALSELLTTASSSSLSSSSSPSLLSPYPFVNPSFPSLQIGGGGESEREGLPISINLEKQGEGAGKLLSCVGNVGLALLRLEHLAAISQHAGAYLTVSGIPSSASSSSTPIEFSVHPFKPPFWTQHSVQLQPAS